VPPIEAVDQVVLAPLRPSVGWYVAGVAVIVLGLGGGFALLTSGAFGYLEDVDELERIGVPGRVDVELSAGEILVYHEPGRGPVAGRDVLGVSIEAPDGRAVELRDATGEDRYLIEGRRGYSIAAFDAASDGRYTIDASGQGTGELAVGPSPRERLTSFGWLALAVSVISLVLGTVMLAITRSRRRHALAARRAEQQGRRVARAARRPTGRPTERLEAAPAVTGSLPAHGRPTSHHRRPLGAAGRPRRERSDRA
jgi:hypothetical protein